jgi:hypothetical protein
MAATIPAMPAPAPPPRDITIIPQFDGDQGEVAPLKAAWSELMQSPTARSDARIAALQPQDLAIVATLGTPHEATLGGFISINPNLMPVVQTTAGPQAAPLSIQMGHELGHRLGGRDDGPGMMNNVNTFENPIRRELGMPERTQY